MRTTINIDEHVLHRAKRSARDAGVTLGVFIERALAREDAAPGRPADEPPLPLIEGGTFLIPVDRMTNAELQDFLDEGVPLDKLR